MDKINTIATIARPRTLIEWGPLSSSACAGTPGVSGPVAGHYAVVRPLVPAMTAVLTAVDAEAGTRGTGLRDAGTTQGPPPRGNPR